MKKLALIYILMHTVQLGWAQEKDTLKSNSVFSVADVPLASQTLQTYPVKTVIENHVGSSIEGYPRSMSNTVLVPTKMHAVIETLHYAFAQHRPVSISPDIIWLMICQGVTQHVNLHSEELRSSIVTFDSTQEIRIQADHLIKGNSNNNWGQLIPSFSDSIKHFVYPAWYNSYAQSFSTTDSIDQFSFQVALLNSVDHYFDFYAETECGIPSITLTGTTEDWRKIENKVDEFKQFGLADWVTELKPILHQFVQASQGAIDLKFWGDIYKVKEDCANIYVSGWIMKFFPYTLNNQYEIVANNNLQKENAQCDVPFDRIPNGISKVNFKWDFNQDEFVSGAVYNMEFCAGFVGINQNAESKMLTPEIIWFVKEQNTALLHDTSNKIKFKDDQINPIGSGTAIENLLLDADCLGPSSTVFMLVEEMPLFDAEHTTNEKESQEAFMAYVAGEIEKLYPNTQFEGTIFVEFVVTNTGNLEAVSILKSDLPNLNETLLDIIEDAPTWKPGIHQGKPVQVRLKLAISFPR